MVLGIVVLLATPNGVTVQVAPGIAGETASVSVDGAGFAFGQTVYAPFGEVAAEVSAPGFISERVTIDPGRHRFVSVTLQEASGRLIARAHPVLDDTRWYLGNTLVEVAKGISVEVEPGPHTLVADHPFYLRETKTIEIGRGAKKTITLALSPVAGRLEITSVPPGAEIRIAGARRGASPGTYDLAGGVYEVLLRHPGYRLTKDTIQITNARPQVSRSYTLAREDATVSFRLAPPGGHLLLDGRRLAKVERVRVDALVEHEAVYVKPGYLSTSVRFTLKPGEHAEKALSLVADIGKVVVQSTPKAAVHVNGRAVGSTPITLPLPALEHEISFTRKGYRGVVRKVMPTSRKTRTVSVKLKSELEARLAETPEVYRLFSDIVMRRFIPGRTGSGRFTMGAPRGEKGRRANEFVRKVRLARVFYVSLHEVTAGQYAAFKAGKASGGAGSSLPATGVSWIDAVRFCNWLSRKEGLKPFYRLQGGRVQSINTRTDGYRLPTEAEWEWLARRAGRQAPVRFVWGNAGTVPKGAGNLADESAKTQVPSYIPRYTDGFAGTAPVGSFPLDKAGLHDLSGNVSEWVHDWYDLLLPRGKGVGVDPLGPPSGPTHVIKGSSWRSASLTEIRGAFRDTAASGRKDLGFRIARYLYGGEDVSKQ